MNLSSSVMFTKGLTALLFNNSEGQIHVMINWLTPVICFTWEIFEHRTNQVMASCAT